MVGRGKHILFFSSVLMIGTLFFKTLLPFKVQLAASVHFTSRIGILCFLEFDIFSYQTTKNNAINGVMSLVSKDY